METLHKFYKKSFCTGPLGFPMRSDDAFELETLVKEAEANGGGYQKTFLTSEDFICKAKDDDLPHTALVTCTTGDVDRDAEVVDAKGLNLKLYQKNKVIAWAHDYSIPPIGRSLWEKLDGNTLKAKIKFADRPEDFPEMAEWFPDTIFALANQQIIKGISIGFLSLDASAPTEKDITANPALVSAKRIIRKSMLLEISVCPIGCNPSALIEQVNKGLVSSEYLDKWGIVAPAAEDKSIWVWDTKTCYAESPAQMTQNDLIRKLLGK